jgi:hypothetical protein
MLQIDASGVRTLTPELSALPLIALTQIPDINPIHLHKLPCHAFNCLVFQPLTGAAGNGDGPQPAYWIG